MGRDYGPDAVWAELPDGRLTILPRAWTSLDLQPAELAAEHPLRLGLQVALELARWVAVRAAAARLGRKVDLAIDIADTRAGGSERRADSVGDRGACRRGGASSSIDGSSQQQARQAMTGKLTASHLERRAYVYVRQSTVAQVIEHRESTARQYALAERAAALGWAADAIEVVDEDQGRSGATSDRRSGFARLVDAVAGGDAGAILALEVSRVARSSTDWQRLLSLCAVADVAVIDEQRVYDPKQTDDKLLLDLKGTMSEAELHWLGLRLQGARRSKARRGALRLAAPTGYVWDEDGFVLDPDQAVQQTIRLLFERFTVEPSAWAVVRWARQQGVQMPTRKTFADGISEVVWKPLGASRLYEMPHNPIYAGTYVYGRRPQTSVIIDGEIRRGRQSGGDPDGWAVKRHDAHPGYISWEQYMRNQDKLRENLARMNYPRRGAPREGPALLCGLLVCGRCGRRMTVAYQRKQQYHSYICAGERDKGQVLCWTLPGAPIDAAVEKLFLQTMVPEQLELTLAVEHQVQHQAEKLQQTWRVQIEKAAYEARRAERRYKAVDPDNRVVARTLEREWEQSLRQLEALEAQYERAREQRRVELSADDRAQIRNLARDLPAVWRAETTEPADRKAMLRIAIEAIAIEPLDVPRRATRVKVQWRGGSVTELEVARPDRRQRLRTPQAAADRLRQLAGDGYRDEQIAEMLTAEGFVTGRGKPWTPWAVKWARRREKIERTAPDRPRRRPLPDRHPDGRYSVAGAAKRFSVSQHVIRRWIKKGLVAARREPFPPYKNVWWLAIDDATAARLEHVLASRTTNR